MDRQTKIAFALISVILIAWLYLNSPKQPTPAETQKIAQLKDSLQRAKQLQQALSANSQDKQIGIPAAGVIEDTAGTAGLFPRFYGNESVITIENDVALFELSNHGAKIRKVYLKTYRNWYSSDNKNSPDFIKTGAQLIDATSKSNLDISFKPAEGDSICSDNLKFESRTVSTHLILKGSDSLSVKYTFTTRDQRVISKVFTFYGDRYSTTVTIGLKNIVPLIVNGMYNLSWNSGIQFVEQSSADESTFANSSIFLGDKQEKVDAPGKDSIDQSFSGSTINWLCFRNKYFANIIAPINHGEVKEAYLSGKSEHFPATKGLIEHYRGFFRIQLLDSDTNYSSSFIVYSGPVKYDLLKSYDKRFDKIVDFGSFLGLSFIIRPIAEYVFLPLFNFLHTLIPNYGLVILLFSIIVKLILQPLSKQSFVSMQKMQALQPKIAEMKEKYKDDPAKVNKETMKLYSTYGINPAGGCLPMLLQMPIFVALWGMFQTVIELRQQPFVWWIKDLSRPDIILSLPFEIPLFGVSDISALALLMGVTTFVQQKMSTKDPSQKAMIYIMPVMLTFLFMSFPAGLNLYYFLFNVLSIAQQYYIMHYSAPVELKPVNNANKKKGIFAKWMEMAEAQQSSNKSKKKK